MFGLTNRIRNRRAPRQDAKTKRTMDATPDKSRSRDIARLYTARIWL